VVVCSFNTGKVFLQVSKAPRYDVPKAAPQPLRLVQAFVNTVDLENEREWLGDPAALAAWARERDLAPAGARFTNRDLDQALELREAFRAVLAANRDRERDAAALAVLTDAARRRHSSAPRSLRDPRPTASTALRQILRRCAGQGAIAFRALPRGARRARLHAVLQGGQEPLFPRRRAVADPDARRHY
jgi:hypothetical protein